VVDSVVMVPQSASVLTVWVVVILVGVGRCSILSLIVERRPCYEIVSD
jgi:hypothetical protein